MVRIQPHYVVLNYHEVFGWKKNERDEKETTPFPFISFPFSFFLKCVKIFQVHQNPLERRGVTSSHMNDGCFFCDAKKLLQIVHFMISIQLFSHYQNLNFTYRLYLYIYIYA